MNKQTRTKQNSPRKKQTDSSIQRPDWRTFLITFPFFLVDKLGKWICLIFLANYLVYLPIKELSGKNTSTLIDIIVKIGANQWISWIAATIFGGGWYIERRSRQKFVKRYGQHEKELMMKNDPDRGTSGLNEDGTSPT